MTHAERFKSALRFKPVDKIPFSPGGPRESTVARWKSDGMPGDSWQAALCEALGLDLSEQKSFSMDVETKMRPTFEEKVLSHENGHYIVRDWMGAVTEISDRFDYTYIRTAKDFVTRKWHRFPVQTRAEWDDMRARYDSDDPARYAKIEAAPAPEGVLHTMAVNGPFWQMREWMGFEGLCFAMADDPELVDEMALFWEEYVARVLARALKSCKIDHIIVNEDMAYKAHSMISPEMTKRYVIPSYRRWKKLIEASGSDCIFDIDSDGYVGTLIPLWIEADIHVNSPLEVAAHNDINAYRAAYGTEIAFRGGVDKRKIAAGGGELRAEMKRLEPAVNAGGYIPGCDHGVPFDISWQNFVDYCGILARMTGWK
ncbi:MAG: hypothetical protein DBY36_02760 [Clostridiales bacterium]|nr:MAG: hypothetical protein DBY36_02760 [Clostridiales bacterium]